MAIRSTPLPGNPYTSAFAVTPGDSTYLTGVTGLFVGGAGNLTVEMLNPETVGATVTFTGVSAGVWLNISVERVLSTGTTATNITALRR